MEKVLMILPFDHRHSLTRDVLGVEGEPDALQAKRVAFFKDLIFEGFKKTLKPYSNKFDFGILVDEKYGSNIITQTKKLGCQLILPVEKSGQKELAFEYGREFGKHIEKFKPDYVKVLVRYNPLEKEINKKQLAKLKELSDYCVKNDYPLILELLVPPTADDLETSGGEAKYDAMLRPEREIEAIKEIKRRTKVAIWKLEWFSWSYWSKIIQVVGHESDIIVLGRGDGKKQVAEWLKMAMKFKKVIGFAVGRTVFMEPLKKLSAGKIDEKKAVNLIAENFDFFVKLWRKRK